MGDPYSSSHRPHRQLLRGVEGEFSSPRINISIEILTLKYVLIVRKDIIETLINKKIPSPFINQIEEGNYFYSAAKNFFAGGFVIKVVIAARINSTDAP